MTNFGLARHWEAAETIAYAGGLDEVAIHREILSPQIIAKRYRRLEQPKPKFVRDDWPIGQGVWSSWSRAFHPARGWPRPDLPPVDSATSKISLGFFPNRTHKYAEPGVRVDRPKTFLLRALSSVTLPSGEHEWLVRSRWSSRIWVDDKLMVSVPQPAKGGGAHHNVPKDTNGLA